MTLARLREARTPQRPHIYIRPTSPTFWQLSWITVLIRLYGENHLLTRGYDDLRMFACDHRLFHLERNRRSGRTRDLPCSSGLFTESFVCGSRIVELGGGVVRPAVRGQGLIILPTAAALCAGLLCDDAETLAVVSVTTREATSAQRALKKVGARCIASQEMADALHPTLGVYYRNVQQTGRDHSLSHDDAQVWVFTGAALRLMIAYIVQAGGQDGLDWELDGGETIRVLVEGFLAEPEVREILYRMAFGVRALPVRLLPDE